MCAGKRNCAQRVAGSSLFVGPRIFSRHSVSVEAVARGAIMYKRRQRQHCVQTQTPCFLGNCKYKKKRSPPGASTCHFDVQTREVIDSARLCSYISTLTHAHTRTHTHTEGMQPSQALAGWRKFQAIAAWRTKNCTSMFWRQQCLGKSDFGCPRVQDIRHTRTVPQWAPHWLRPTLLFMINWTMGPWASDKRTRMYTQDCPLA